jgi:hypothetical protein
LLVFLFGRSGVHSVVAGAPLHSQVLGSHGGSQDGTMDCNVEEPMILKEDAGDYKIRYTYRVVWTVRVLY